ncbi:MAG: hypothetical protein KKH68_04430 [Proteobacteria bacterium]|nr:hypothetical protein [Pseudomonadota bacterium]
MLSKYLTEQQYFNFVAAVATLNDCQLVDIDFFEQTIKIEGHPKSVCACSAELEELLGR